MHIGVLGAGAWGTALAIAAAADARAHRVLLYTRDAQHLQSLHDERRNTRYLPEVGFPPALALTSDLPALFAHAQGGLLLIATPMAGLRAALAALPSTVPALWLCKGFEQGSGLLGHEIAQALRPGAPAGILSGPSFALEVARGWPTALVAASPDATLVERAVEAFHGGALRIYGSADLVGVEVGGAVKNVLAIATGIVDGMPDTGANARAALITRGLAEMTRLGVALGAQPQTFMGLSGVGDLVLTATGDLSRNRRVGLRLAAGLPLARILAELGHVAEGVLSAPVVLQRARAAGVEMPITEAVCAVLEGREQPVHAMQRLMARRARDESA